VPLGGPDRGVAGGQCWPGLPHQRPAQEPEYRRPHLRGRARNGPAPCGPAGQRERVSLPLMSQAGARNFEYGGWVWWTGAQFGRFAFWIHA
jgi:hypothetical protein